MSVILNPGGGTGGGGGNIVDSLEATLQAGNTTGAASGILVNDGDKIAMASGALITFSSNANPGGLPDVLIQRSGVKTIAINQPGGGGGTTVNIGASGILALGTDSLDPRIVKRHGGAIEFRDGLNNKAEIYGYSFEVGNPSSAARLSSSDGFLSLSSQGKVTFSANAIGGAGIGLQRDTAISRSGVGLVAFENLLTSAPATGHLSSIILGPLSASGSRLANDNNGRVLVQDAVGVPGNILLDGINFGPPTTAGALMSRSSSDIVIRRGDGGQGNSGSSLRIAKYGTAINCALQLNNEIFDGMFGLSSSHISTAISGVEQFRVSNTGISIGSRLLMGATLGNVDVEVARSGAGELAVRNPITNGPANLTVGDLTVLGTHNISVGGGAGSTIFATGLIVGDHSASGSKIVSDANGRLIVQNGNSALGPIFASELKFGHPTITAQQYLLKNSSLSNGGAMLVDITSTTQQYLTVLGVYGANQEEFFLGTNGLDIQGNADIRWNSNSNDILSNFDLQVSRSGVGLIAINNPSTGAPATGHLNAAILGPLSASGSRLANDNNGTLLVQNGVGVMGDLKVQNLTILGNQTGGASSAVITPVFSTGIVIGAHSASGSKLVSDSNGLLLVQQADTLGFGGINVGPSGKIAWGYDAFDGSAAIFYEGNGTLSVRNIGNTSPGYMRALEFQAVQGNTVRAQISANNGITLTSPYRLAFNSSSTDITVAPDTSIARSGVGLLTLYNPIISEPANFMSKNNGTMIQSSGAISGSLQIDMQGAKVQTFSVSTTGSFAAYNMLGHMSYEKYLYMTAVGTVGLSFDTNWKWLGAKPTSIASGNTYLITLNNYGATSSDVLASYAVLGPGT